MNEIFVASRYVRMSYNRRVLAETRMFFCLQAFMAQPIPSLLLFPLLPPHTTTSSQTEQAKHWEEVKALKDSEAMLLEECERINQVRTCCRAAVSVSILQIARSTWSCMLPYMNEPKCVT
jgi:hypothetical protein